MKIQQKSVLVKAAAVFDALEEVDAVVARQELIEYIAELRQVALALQDEFDRSALEKQLVAYTVKGAPPGQMKRREHWVRTVLMPVVAAQVAVRNYFVAMDTVRVARFATPDETRHKGWDVVVRFVSGHEYGVVVLAGSNEMHLRHGTVRFGLPYREIDGYEVRDLRLLDQRVFNELEGVRMVHA